MGKINSYSLIDGIEGHEDDLLVLETFEGTRTVTPGQITAAIEGEVTEIKEDFRQLQEEQDELISAVEKVLNGENLPLADEEEY